MVNSVSRHPAAFAHNTFHFSSALHRGSVGLLPAWFLLALAGVCCAFFCFLPWSPNTLHIVFIVLSASIGGVFAIIHILLTRLIVGAAQRRVNGSREARNHIPNDLSSVQFRASSSSSEQKCANGCPLLRLAFLRQALPVVELIVLGLLVLFSPRVMPSGMGEDNILVPGGKGSREFPVIIAWRVVVLHMWFLFAMNIPLIAGLGVGVVHYVVLIAHYKYVEIVTFIVAAQWIVFPLLYLIVLFAYHSRSCGPFTHVNDECDNCEIQSDEIIDMEPNNRHLGTHWAYATKSTSAIAMASQRHDDAKDVLFLVLRDSGTVVAEVSPSLAALMGVSPHTVSGRRLAPLLDELCVEKPEQFLQAVTAIACGDSARLETDDEYDEGFHGSDELNMLSPSSVRVELLSDEVTGDYSTLSRRRYLHSRMGGTTRRLLLRGRSFASPNLTDSLPNSLPCHKRKQHAEAFCVTLSAWSRRDGLVMLRQPRLHAVLDRMQWPAMLVHPLNGRVLHWSPAAAQLTGIPANDVIGWPVQLSAKDGDVCARTALEAWLHPPADTAARGISLEPLAGEFTEEESAALERNIVCFTWPPRYFSWQSKSNKNEELSRPEWGGSSVESFSSSGGEDYGSGRENNNLAHGRGRVQPELPLPANCDSMFATSPEAFSKEENRETQWYFAPIANGRGDAHAWATAGVPLLCLLREDTLPIKRLTDCSCHTPQQIQQKHGGRVKYAMNDVVRECHAFLCNVMNQGDSKQQWNTSTECTERAVTALECYLQECREDHVELSGDEHAVGIKQLSRLETTATPESAKKSIRKTTLPFLLMKGVEQRNQAKLKEERKSHSDNDDGDDDSSDEANAKTREKSVREDLSKELSETRDGGRSPKCAILQQSRSQRRGQRSQGRGENSGTRKGSFVESHSSLSQKTSVPRLISPLPVEKFMTGKDVSTITAGPEVVDARNPRQHSPKKVAQPSSGVETPILAHSSEVSEFVSSPTKNNVIVSSNNNNINNSKNDNNVENRSDGEEPMWAMLRSSDEATIASCYICVRPGEVFFFGRSSKCHATTSDSLVSSIQFAIIAQQQQQHQNPHNLQQAPSNNNVSSVSTLCGSRRNGPFDGWTVTLHDHSANGTFVNVKKIGKGKSTVLHDHDLVTFRLSTSRFFLGFQFILLDESGVPQQRTASPTLSRPGSRPLSRRGTPHTYHYNHPQQQQQQQQGNYQNCSLENGSSAGGGHASGTPIYKNRSGSGRRLGTTQSRSSRLGGSASHHRETIEWKIGEEMLGKGGNAEVYLGINLTNGTLIAVKRVLLPTCEEGEANRAVLQQYRSLQEEINVLSKAAHPNIVQYYGSSQNQTYFNILLEFVPGGSLRHILDNFGGLSPGVIFLYLRQTLEGLRYLHQHNIVHSDVKAANILVTDKGRVKLSDFGTAKLLSHRQHSQSVDRSGKTASAPVVGDSTDGDVGAETHCTHRVTGTLRWMAPELIRDDLEEGPTKASDIWSVGCAIIEMLSSNAPWWEYEFESEEQIINLLRYATEPPEIPECNECPEIRDIAARCLVFAPNERPSCEELLQRVIDAAECFQARQSPSVSTMREGSIAAPPTITSVEESSIQPQL